MAAPPTEYELLRAQKIARNAEIMAELGVIEASSDVKSEIRDRKRPRSTGIKGAKRSPQKDQPVVIRRSLRTRGLPPTLASGVDGDRSTTSTEIIGRPQPEASHPPSPKLTSGPINLLEEDSNAKLLLELLQRTECSSNDITSDVEVKDNEFALFKDLKQVEKDVAKVVKDRVYFAEFLPLRNKHIVVVGDRSGQLGFWDLDYESTNADEGDGVYTFQTHLRAISGLIFPMTNSKKIISSSYDGTVRQLDINAECIDLVHSDENLSFSSCAEHPSGHALFLGDTDGKLVQLDLREKALVSEHDIHAKKVNCLSFSPASEHILLSCSTDTNVCLWDVRKLGRMDNVPIITFPHKNSVTSALFSPDGGKFASTSYDNTIKVWDNVYKATETINVEQKVVAPSVFNHDNDTGRWVTPFRAIWFNNDFILVGGKKKVVDILSVSTRKSSYLSSEFMTTIPARLGVCANAHSVVGGNASGKVYVWRK